MTTEKKCNRLGHRATAEGHCVDCPPVPAETAPPVTQKVKVFWLTLDSDEPLRTWIFATEAEQRATHVELVLGYWKDWVGDDKPFPMCPGDPTEPDVVEAWDQLTSRLGFMDSINWGEEEIDADISQTKAGQFVRMVAGFENRDEMEANERADITTDTLDTFDNIIANARAQCGIERPDIAATDPDWVHPDDKAVP